MSARWKTASTACGVSALQAGVIIGDFSAFPDESSIFSAIHLLNSVELSIFATTYNELQQVDAVLKTIPASSRQAYLADLKNNFKK